MRAALKTRELICSLGLIRGLLPARVKMMPPIMSGLNPPMRASGRAIFARAQIARAAIGTRPFEFDIAEFFWVHLFSLPNDGDDI